MSFVVNGADWDFNGLNSSKVEELIDRALAFIETSRERGEVVLIGDDFQSRPMYGEAKLWELFSPDSPLSLPYELSQELTAWLMSAPRYADSESWPEGVEDAMISIGGVPSALNEDVAWVHYSIRSRKPCAVLSLHTSGEIDTITDSGDAKIHFVNDEQGRTHFWRDMIVLDGDSLQSLLQFASRAYPELYFIEGVLNDADHLTGGYLALRRDVQRALEMLNDRGHWIFTTPPPALTPDEVSPPDSDASLGNQLIERRFAASGINAAPENPNVRGDRVSREAREAIISGRILYCEWHVKLQRHQNRIYFHKPVVESENKIIIGMISSHLPLP